MSRHDVRGTATWDVVTTWFERSLGPGFGQPARCLEPSVSVDGRRVVLTGTVLDRLDGLPRSVVCTADDGGLTVLTQGAGSARLPRVSPDGSTVAFLSDRAATGVFQLYLLVDGLGEARPAPAVPGTVEYAAWSPDGARVLLGVAGLGADLAGGQGSGTTARPAESLPEWHPRVEAGAEEDAWRSLWVHDVAAGTVQRVSPQGVNVWEAGWLGADALVAVTSERPDEGAWYTARLTRLGLDGSVTPLHESGVQMGLPAGSPDGARLAVVEAVCSDRWVVAGDLLVGPPSALEPVDTAGVDVTVVQWVDSTTLGFLGVRGLETVAVVLDVETGKTTELWASTDTSCGTRYPEGAFLADGRVVVVEEGYRLPQRLVVRGEGTCEVLATWEHPGHAYVLEHAGRVEPVSWTAPDGLLVEGLLCLPEGPGPHPLLLNVHGGPVWGYRNLWSLFYSWTPFLVSRGFAVLNPNPRGSSGRGQDFARQVFGDMGGADTQDFLSGVDALVERGVADPARLAVMGGSYGGFMSSWLVTQDDRFAAAVPVAPVTDWFSQHFTSNIPYFDQLFLADDPERAGGRHHSRSPVLQASAVTTPCLNVAGALDRCTPAGQAEEFHRALLEHGVESHLVVYPREGHGVRAFPALIDFVTRVTDFLERHTR